MELKLLTEKLYTILNQLKDKYEKNEPPEKRRDRKFFSKVKAETMPMYEMLDKWEVSALDAVKSREVNVHPHQVTSTKENMELLLMHSYYVDARRKRYMELYKSVAYIFDQMIKEL